VWTGGKGREARAKQKNRAKQQNSSLRTGKLASCTSPHSPLPTPHSLLSTLRSRLATPDSALRTPDSRLPLVLQPPTSYPRPPTPDARSCLHTYTPTCPRVPSSRAPAHLQVSSSHASNLKPRDSRLETQGENAEASRVAVHGSRLTGNKASIRMGMGSLTRKNFDLG